MTRPTFRAEVLIILFAGNLLAGAALAGEAASVNGRNVVNTPDNAINVAAGADGLALAGAQVFNPAQLDNRVSRAPGGAAGNQMTTNPQDGVIAPLYVKAANIASVLPAGVNQPPNAAQTAAANAAKAAYHTAANNVLLDDAFPDVAKAAGTDLIADTANLMNPQAFEQAHGTALQHVVQFAAPKIQVNFTETATSTATAKQVRKPMATSFALNSDPMGVVWGPAPALTFDPSSTQLSVQGGSLGGSAVALWDSEADYINGTTDLAQPQSASQPLYELTLLDYTLNDDSPTDFVFFDVFSPDVSDSLGGVGLSDVTADLMASITFNDGQLGFADDFTFTVGIPGDPGESDIFVTDQAMTAVADVPEPAGFGFALFAAGGIGLAARRGWRALPAIGGWHGRSIGKASGRHYMW